MTKTFEEQFGCKNTNQLNEVWSHWFFYGESGCLAADTLLRYVAWTPDGRRFNGKGGSIERLYERFHGLPARVAKQGKYLRPQNIGATFTVPAMNEEGRLFENRIVDVVYSGEREVFSLQTICGRKILATADHKFCVGADAVFVPLHKLEPGQRVWVRAAERALPDRERPRGQRYAARWPVEPTIISAITPAGMQHTYDLVMADPCRNFVANDFVVHNSGKTTAASSFPRPLFIVPYNEQSVVTLRGLDYPYFLVTDMDKTRFDPRTGMGGMVQIVSRIEEFYNKNPNDFPYDTIIVESMTHYCELVQEQITNGAQKIMAQNDWGTQSSHIRMIQLRLRRLQVHSVFTALDKTESDADGKVLFGGPALPGQLATKFPSSCDCAGYAEVIPGKDGQIFRMHFQKHRHYPARSRFRRMPKRVTNFTFDQIAHVLEPDDGRADANSTAEETES